MAEIPPARRPPGESYHLRDLAAWYREFAERAGNPAIWEARLRTAQDLEAEAERAELSLDPADPPNDGGAQNARVAALRAEAHRLVVMATSISDIEARQQFASQALRLSQRAEAIARSQEDPTIVRMNIERYRKMLAAGIDDPAKRQAIDDMLADAEAVLATRRGM